MAKQRRISKVNYNPTSGKTVIAYQTTENDGRDEFDHVCRSRDEPLPELLEALGALAPRICKLLDLPSGYLDTVRGITLQRDDEDPDAFTVTYTATKRIEASNSPFVVNTPSVEPPRGPDGGKQIRAVLAAAEGYLDGQRAQAALPGME